MEKNKKNIWLHINKMNHRGDENYGLLLNFHVNGLHWELYYRGDAPLVIYYNHGTKHILQVDGDLFYPILVNLCDKDNTDVDACDSYYCSIEEALKFINIMLYEDMELENEEGEEAEWPEYDLSYIGKNEAAFKTLECRIANGDQILEADIVGLN